MTDHTPPTDQELDAIEARAGAATPGPWRRPLNTRYKHTVTAPLPDDERGSYLDGIDPVTGEREQCTVAAIPIWSNGKHSRQRGGRDLEYIAAMHPEMAKTLVAEVRRLRARVWDLERPGVEAQRNEIRQSFAELAAQCRDDRDHEGAFEVECRLREREEQWKREDAASQPEAQSAVPDTLPAWLYQRFAVIHGLPAWERATDGDRAYWERHAAAVRRAVARGGFKTTRPAVRPAVETGARPA